jgi:hypothetical protein
VGDKVTGFAAEVKVEAFETLKIFQGERKKHRLKEELHLPLDLKCGGLRVVGSFS